MTLTQDPPRIRRGLPRVPGGEPWPPAAEAGAGSPAVADAGGVAEAGAAAAAVAPRQSAGPAVSDAHSDAGEPAGAATAGVQPRQSAGPAVADAHMDAGERAGGAAAGESQQRMLRRGLPRVPGGDLWPPASVVPAMEVANPVRPRDSAGADAGNPQIGAGEGATPAEAQVRPRHIAGADAGDPQIGAGEREASVDAGVGPLAGAGDGQPDAPMDAADSDTPDPALRRGLPRTPGGEPWPPATSARPAAEGLPLKAETATQPATSAGQRELVFTQDARPQHSADAAPSHPQPGAAEPDSSGQMLRRGLPRTPGGEPWPPAGSAPTVARPLDADPGAAVTEQASEAERSEAAVEQLLGTVSKPIEASLVSAAVVESAEASASTPAQAAAQAEPGSAIVPIADVATPLPSPRNVYPGAAAARWKAQRLGQASVVARVEPTRYGPFTRVEWAGAVIVGGFGLLAAAVLAVLAMRWFLSLDFMRDFLAAYPGEYELPDVAPVGIPAWLSWVHFFNAFLIVLIIRTGITVHNEKRPSAFWSPRTNSKRKISLTLWFHQSLDILWLVNGVAYVVLLLATAQWMRIVPTSWDVFPNALSAGLQYVSLDWPTENGWVNYNSLQQLAYFSTVFIAAPLATITGVRMSGIWPKKSETLNRLFPLEWARKVHLPVMVFFVAFIVVHVALVFATNALRNLNHMYGGQDAVNWFGFWVFAASMGVIAAGWFASRTLVLAPIARLFGTVSAR